MADQTNKTDIVLGVILMGTTGVLIGYFWDSYALIAIAGALGSIVGGFVGWLGGRRYMAIILGGGAIGFLLGRQTGNQDILIMATGSGAAIAGFLGAQMERFFRARKNEK
jgi:hypothetical protein